MDRSSLILRFPGFSVLVLRNGSDRNITDDILMGLDAILLLQWNKRIHSSLMVIFSRLQSSCSVIDSSVGREKIAKHSLRCILLPHSETFGGRRCDGRGGGIVGSRSHPSFLNTLTMASELGVSVLRISPPVPADHLPNGDHISTFLEKSAYRLRSLSLRSRTNVFHIGPNKGILLFRKFGLGSLEVVPIFCAPKNTRLDVIFLWQSAALPSNKNFSTFKSNRLSVCCTVSGYADMDPIHSSVQSSKIANSTFQKLDTKQDPSRMLRELVAGLTKSTICHPNRQFMHGITTKRIGLPVSYTYTAGLNDFETMRATHLDLKWPVKYFREQGVQEETSSYTISERENDPGSVDHMDAINTDLHRVISSKPALDYNNGTDITPNFITLTETFENMSRKATLDTAIEPKANCENGLLPNIHHSETAEKVEYMRTKMNADIPLVNINMHKSPSCPTSLSTKNFPGDDGETIRPTTLWDHCHPQSLAYSATVLLAIPELGESDYYSESPQCLTTEDLRKLGLYDDDDDEDDDAEEEQVNDGITDNKPLKFDNSSCQFDPDRPPLLNTELEWVPASCQE